MQNIFLHPEKEALINRINQLTSTTQPHWGKMNVAQMLAHCNIVPFELIYDPTRPRPNVFMRLMLRLFARPNAVGNKPYKKNSPTGSDFKITTEKDFLTERQRLIDQINKTHELGVDYFLDKESPFGKLTKNEWIGLFYSHLNHHLTQFGV